jgi:hypothetical protein
MKATYCGWNLKELASVAGLSTMVSPEDSLSSEVFWDLEIVRKGEGRVAGPIEVRLAVVVKRHGLCKAHGGVEHLLRHALHLLQAVT